MVVLSSDLLVKPTPLLIFPLIHASERDDGGRVDPGAWGDYSDDSGDREVG